MSLSFNEALLIINDYLANPGKYVFPFEIKEKNKKVRKIITYNDDENGDNLREIHTYIAKNIRGFYQSSKLSFAYKKNNCCLNAVSDHLHSNFFIKLDIKSFFETITEDKFLEHYPALFENYGRKKRWNLFLKSVFYQSHLSIGYVTSPIISDIYLSDFDKAIEKYIKKYGPRKLHYSRYSDDILISCSGNNWTVLEGLFEKIRDELKLYSLEINEKKTQKVELNKKDQNSITFLGLNISKNVKSLFNKNKITVSKSYILRILDLLEKYYDEGNKNNVFLRLRILSSIAYIEKNAYLSYNKFLKKHLNRFGKEYSGI